jgi:hypothetical protein
VAGAIEHDVLVDLVAEQDDVGTAQEVDERLHVVGAEHRAGRVVRTVDHQHPRARGDRGTYRVPVRREAERIQRDMHRLRAGQVDRRFVAVVAGVEDDHLVAGPNDGMDRIEDRLGGAAGDRDLAVGIGSPAIAAFGLAGDRLAQRGHAAHHRVLVVAGLHRPGQCIDQAPGHREIRKALAQVDRAVLGGQLRHHGEDGGADLRQFGLWLHRTVGLAWEHEFTESGRAHA